MGQTRSARITEAEEMDGKDTKEEVATHGLQHNGKSGYGKRRDQPRHSLFYL